MPNAIDHRGFAFKGGTSTQLARVVGDGNVAITRATVSAISYTIYLVDPEDPDNDLAVAGHTDEDLVVASVVFDTLQTDSRWSVDATGYNFRHTIDVATDQAFAEADRRYRIVYTITPASGQAILLRYLVTVL